MKIHTSIAHAAHLEERKPTLERMLASLGDRWPVHIESGKAPNFVWSERQWRASLSEGTTHGLFLNDDLMLCEDFYEALERVIAARPDDVISLYCSDPKAMNLMGRWYTSRDGLIGNAYVIPTHLLTEFLDFRHRCMMPHSRENYPNGGLTEDQQINLWCMATGRKIWHTRPSLVEHDSSLPSSYGNDGNAARTSALGPWRNMKSLNWAVPQGMKVPHLGRFFKGNYWYLLKAIRPEYWREHDCVRKFYQYDADSIHSIRYQFGAAQEQNCVEWSDPNDLPDGHYQKKLCLERYEWACRWIKPGAVVANAACGSNFGTPMLMRAGAAKVVGVDNGEEQMRINAAKGYGEFSLANIEDLRFSGFDTLVCIETLEHLQDPWRFLKNLSANVRNLIASVPIVPTKHANRHHLHDFDRESIMDGLVALGWELQAWAIQDDPGWNGGTQDMCLFIYATR